MERDKRKQKVSAVTDTLPISDTACEEAVLGALIGDVNCYDRTVDYLSGECFYSEKNRAVYNAIKALRDAGEPTDMITVCTMLSKMGVAIVTPVDVASISSKGIGAYGQVNYAQHLLELSIRRKLWFIGQELMNAGSSEAISLDEAENRFKEKFDGVFDSQDAAISTLRDGIEDLCTLINENYAGKNNEVITRSGFTKLDEAGGLRPSDLIIVAGDTSQGKTSFAQALTLSAIQQGKMVAFYSMEMKRLQLTSRLVSAVSGIPSSRITDQILLDWEVRNFNDAVESLSVDNLLFDDRSSSNIDTIIASIRSLKRKQGIAGVVIDYAQILSINAGRQTTEEQQLGELARRLKNLAKELNVFIILLSQLNRDANNPLPKRERLRGSGQMAEAADVVLLVYRPEVYGTQYPKPYESVSTKGTAMIRIAKNRNGGIADFIVGFDPALTKFYDLTEGSLPQEKESDPFAL